MEFEWDEAKRISNLAKHGLDFADADLLFLAPYARVPARSARDEQRWLAIGIMSGLPTTAVFTMRQGVITLISLRR